MGGFFLTARAIGALDGKVGRLAQLVVFIVGLAGVFGLIFVLNRIEFVRNHFYEPNTSPPGYQRNQLEQLDQTIFQINKPAEPQK